MTISVYDEVMDINNYLVARKKGWKGLFSTARDDMHKTCQGAELMNALRDYDKSNNTYALSIEINVLIRKELNYHQASPLDSVLLNKLLRLEKLVIDEMIQNDDVTSLHSVYKQIEARCEKFYNVGGGPMSKAIVNEWITDFRQKLLDSNKPEMIHLLAQVISEMKSVFKNSFINDLHKKINKTNPGLAAEIKDIYNGSRPMLVRKSSLRHVI